MDKIEEWKAMEGVQVKERGRDTTKVYTIFQYDPTFRKFILTSGVEKMEIHGTEDGFWQEYERIPSGDNKVSSAEKRPQPRPRTRRQKG